MVPNFRNPRVRVVLVLLCVGVSASSWLIAAGALASHGQGTITVSPARVVVDSPVTFQAQVVAHGTDVCRVRSEGGYSSGFVSCVLSTWTHTYLVEGEKWTTLEIADALQNVYRVTVQKFTVWPTSNVEVKVNNVPNVNLVSPSPVPVTWASPLPVSFPTPLPVRWRGCFEPEASCPTGGGLSPDDSENVELLHEDVRSMRWTVVVAAGFALFALAGLIVLGLRRLFR